MKTPRVSMIIPCLNEARSVERVLRSLLDGSHPADELEILVVDGGSTDGTRDIVARLAAADGRLRLLDNPRRIPPAALNLGIRAARAEIVLRGDAHTVYPRDYVAVLVRTLDETGADLVGCVASTAPGGDGALAQAIAIAACGRFATASPFRTRTQSGDADTVPFGCWRKSLFERIGLFDERLVRNQDLEHASRIRRAGGRIFLTTETCVSYLVRPTLRELWAHARATGLWNAFTERLHPYTFRWRHLLPGLFFAGVIVAALAMLAGLLLATPWLAVLGLLALAPYVAADLASSLVQARAHGRVGWTPLVAFITASVHFSYGYGVAKGWMLVASGAWRRHLAPSGDGVPVTAARASSG